MWKLALPLILLCAGIVLAVMLDRPASRADIVVINRGDVATLDLHRMSWLQDLRVAAALWEGLVRPDALSPGFEPRPGVAESWEVSPDGLTYTFHLRADARWSSGEPVTSRDFKRTWLRAILPDTGGDYLNLFGLIRGMQELVAWREQTVGELAKSSLEGTERQAAGETLWVQTRERYDRTVGVETPDPRTLVIHLERPTPYFLDILGYEITYPLNVKSFEPYERVDPRTGRLVMESGWLQPGTLVTNGPYVLSAWLFKREMRLTRNEQYWNRANVHAATISMPCVEDPNAAVVAARSGAADWLTDVAAECRRELVTAKNQYMREHDAEVQSLRAQGLGELELQRRLPPDPRQNVHVIPSFGTYFLNMNCGAALPDGRKNPLADPRVRKALALAVDKQAIADVRGIGEPVAGSLTPPGSIAGYAAPKGLGRDPEQARRLLAEAGYPGGKGLPPIEILFNKDAGHDLTCQSIAGDWRRELGIDVALRQKERKVFREDLKHRNFMVSTANWFGDYGDPTTFLDLNRTGDGNNDRGFSDPRYDGLLDSSQNEPNAATRLTRLAEAERIMVEEQLPLVPLVHECSVYLFDPHRITGISGHPRQKQQLGLLSVER